MSTTTITFYVPQDGEHLDRSDSRVTVLDSDPATETSVVEFTDGLLLTAPWSALTRRTVHA